MLRGGVDDGRVDGGAAQPNENQARQCGPLPQRQKQQDDAAQDDALPKAHHLGV